tara:strand:- start:47835 stop:48002 length:168 start_codon:yes stop_codon:yes gene_type:complete
MHNPQPSFPNDPQLEKVEPVKRIAWEYVHHYFIYITLEQQLLLADKEELRKVCQC